jgi:hypothetical protein
VVTVGLAAMLENPSFREYVISRALGKPMTGISEDQRAMLNAVNLIGNTFEEVGNLTKNDVVDEGRLPECD